MKNDDRLDTEGDLSRQRRDETWSFEGFEDLPVPRWNDDELDEAYEHLWGNEETRSEWHLMTCSDGIGHAFDTHSPRMTYGVYPRPLCGRAVQPLPAFSGIPPKAGGGTPHSAGQAMPTAFCADCVARKAPN